MMKCPFCDGEFVKLSPTTWKCSSCRAEVGFDGTAQTKMRAEQAGGNGLVEIGAEPTAGLFGEDT